jgi:RNA polymerase sigma-70 factor (ECF subfamily)
VEHFREFYKKHRDRLFAYLMRSSGDYHLSSDIMQESFTRYLEKYGNGNLSAPLLYTIARNALIDSYRRQRHGDLTLSENESLQPNSESNIFVREEYKRLLSAMQKLAPEERDVLSMVVSSDLTYKEIARVTGTTEGNVKVRVHRARVKLKQIMNEGPPWKRF